MVKGTYEALNTQLMMELPVLTRCGAEIVILSTKSLVAARMYLQGHLAQLYLHLAQVSIVMAQLCIFNWLSLIVVIGHSQWHVLLRSKVNIAYPIKKSLKISISIYVFI